MNLLIDHLLYFAVTLAIGFVVGWKLRGNSSVSTQKKDPTDQE